MRGRVFSDRDELEAMLEQYDNNVSPNKLAKIYGCYQQSIRYWVKKTGRELRDASTAQRLVWAAKPRKIKPAKAPRPKKINWAEFQHPHQPRRSKSYAQIVADAVNRGDRTIQAVTGLRPRTPLQ